MNSPRCLDEAITRILPLSERETRDLFVPHGPFERDMPTLSPEDIALIQCHFSLGSGIRHELGFWGEWNCEFMDQLAEAVPEYPFFDADSASAAMVLLLRKILDPSRRAAS
jgi:hypothetical protein